MSQYDLPYFEYEVCKCLLEAFCWLTLTDIHQDTKALLYPIWACTYGVTIERCPILTLCMHCFANDGSMLTAE